ncbi:MAG: FIG01126328: hypothetical protein, partial [uncultured Rubrobacteraceae bacterium]
GPRDTGQVHREDRRALRRLPDRDARKPPPGDRQMAPHGARHDADAARAVQAPGERVPGRRVLLLRSGSGAGPVLAFVRGPGEVRPQPGRPAHAGVAEVQQGGQEGRGRRHLARDLPRRAGLLRGDLLQHARVRFGEGHRAGARRGRQGDRPSPPHEGGAGSGL